MIPEIFENRSQCNFFHKILYEITFGISHYFYQKCFPWNISKFPIDMLFYSLNHLLNYP